MGTKRSFALATFGLLSCVGALGSFVLLIIVASVWASICDAYPYTCMISIWPAVAKMLFSTFVVSFVLWSLFMEIQNRRGLVVQDLESEKFRSRLKPESPYY